LITIYPNTNNIFLIFVDNLDFFKEEYRIIATKPELYNISKTFLITNLNVLEYGWDNAQYLLQLNFCEVEAVDETLIGNVNLHDKSGEWVFEVQTKNALDIDWVYTYKDLAKVLPLQDDYIIYNN